MAKKGRQADGRVWTTPSSCVFSPRSPGNKSDLSPRVHPMPEPPLHQCQRTMRLDSARALCHALGYPSTASSPVFKIQTQMQIRPFEQTLALPCFQCKQMRQAAGLHLRVLVKQGQAGRSKTQTRGPGSPCDCEAMLVTVHTHTHPIYPLPHKGWVLALSREYWQLAMTRQKSRTHKSLQKPRFSVRKPRRETRTLSRIATTFSFTSSVLCKTHKQAWSKTCSHVIIKASFPTCIHRLTVSSAGLCGASPCIDLFLCC